MPYTLHEARKFQDPKVTAKGEQRASVSYTGTKTLWFNTGTLCNIACENCYIESSPTNDRLVYLGVEDVTPFLDELKNSGEDNIEIGFTGGEPFMAPEIIEILDTVLKRGHHVLMLSNAMQPMMRPHIKEGLLALNEKYNHRLLMRVSLDHYTAKLHDTERGMGAFGLTRIGLQWLADNKFNVAIAGRTMWDEDEIAAREGYGDLIQEIGLNIDPNDPSMLVLFPEMEADGDPPEITVDCWNILDVSPDDQMCASQRMVVKRRGADRATVVACTLLPYDMQFELGDTLEDARKDVSLNHPYCASFCVLGGGSCSA